jgi:phosphoribosylamine---glycine ligase
VLYAGLMMTDKGPYVLEFNARMGDPETQPLLMRLKSDIVPILHEVARGGSIRGMELAWEDGPSVCVVMASGGYPGSYAEGQGHHRPDRGGQDRRSKGLPRRHQAPGRPDRHLRGQGPGRHRRRGRPEERHSDRAYRAADLISFDNMHFRKDIGHKALRRLP